MKARYGFYALLVVLAAGLIASGAEARDYTLKKIDPEIKAIGEVTVRHDGWMRSDRLLSIDVFRLKPNSVYSVWLFRDGKRAPAGLKGQNFFRTDGSGNAHYADQTDEYTLRFKTVEIAYHPDRADGDVRNTAEMVIVLSTRLFE